MTLSSETSRVSYNGDGTTASFSTVFKFIENSHVAVTLRRADTTEVDWVEGTQYTLTGAGSDSGGTVLASASPTDYRPANGEVLVIRRVVPLVQETDLPLGGPLPTPTMEEAFDLAAMRDQQLQEQLDRTLRFPVTDTVPLPALPSFSTRANKVLAFDSSGNPTLYGVGTVLGDASTVTASGSTAARSLAERFGQATTPRDYGAVGDGTADDTAALLACLKDGKPTFLEAGLTYKITDALDLRGYSGLIVFGAGAAASPDGAFENSGPAIIRQATSNKQILRLSGSHHQLSGFYLDYSSQQTTSNTASRALELNNVSRSSFRDLRIYRANTSIGIPQSAHSPTSYNTVFDCDFDNIDSNTASECHIDLRNYSGGGTNTMLRNIYINGGGSLDFVTAGQSANYAMRFTNWSGLEICATSIDGLILNTNGIVFTNCNYVMPTVRFEACTIIPNAAVWIDHAGGYCDAWVGFLALTNCKWSPSAASTMYVVQAQSTIIKLRIEKIRIASDCAFGSSGVRRAFVNNGPGLSGTGYVNDIRVGAVEDTGSKLTDLTWTDSNGSSRPVAIREWNGAFPHLRLRANASTTTVILTGGTAAPTAGTWEVGDIVINIAPGDIGRPWGWQCTTAGTPGTWVPIAFGGASGGGATTWGDAGATLTPGTSRKTNIWITTLTADRDATIASSGQWSGCTFRVARPAGGAFVLNVKNPAGSVLKALAAGEWCEVTYDSFNWRLTAFGSGV